MQESITQESYLPRPSKTPEIAAKDKANKKEYTEYNEEVTARKIFSSPTKAGPSCQPPAIDAQTLSIPDISPQSGNVVPGGISSVEASPHLTTTEKYPSYAK